MTPLTPPEDVLAFIDSQPGLYEICEMFPSLLIEYAPQLTIPGFAGDFEGLFAKLYEHSIAQCDELRRQGSRFGTALTDGGQQPLCDEEWALRHPMFGGYRPSMVANAYFSGGIFGPPVSPYEHTDHMVWLLSEASAWLPARVRQILSDGMADWGVWLWTSGDWPSGGSLLHALYDTAEGKPFRWSPKRKEDVLSRFRLTIHTLLLPETAEALLVRFVDHDFVGEWISSRRERSAREDEP